MVAVIISSLFFLGGDIPKITHCRAESCSRNQYTTLWLTIPCEKTNAGI
jgi:hypothetical protein